MDQLKTCIKCNRDLPMNNEYFHRNNKKKDGFHNDCKECKGFKFTNTPRGYKICAGCGDELPANLEYFHKNKSCKENLHSKCKKCTAIYRVQYYEKNAERYRSSAKKSYESNKERYIMNVEKRRSRKRKLKNTLTLKQWSKIKDHFNNSCAYCGMNEEEHLLRHKEKLHQEHFVPLTKEGEYTINNIIPSCKICNASKSNKIFYEWYPTYKHYNEDRMNIIVKYIEQVDCI